jgi:hypothetical protein
MSDINRSALVADIKNECERLYKFWKQKNKEIKENLYKLAFPYDPIHEYIQKHEAEIENKYIEIFKAFDDNNENKSHNPNLISYKTMCEITLTCDVAIDEFNALYFNGCNGFNYHHMTDIDYKINYKEIEIIIAESLLDPSCEFIRLYFTSNGVQMLQQFEYKSCIWSMKKYTVAYN